MYWNKKNARVEDESDLNSSNLHIVYTYPKIPS